MRLFQSYTSYTTVYVGWSDVTVICGHIIISMLCGNTVYCVKLSGEYLSHYSNKIEFPYYHSLTKKVMSQQQTFLRVCSKTASTDMVWKITSLWPNNYLTTNWLLPSLPEACNNVSLSQSSTDSLGHNQHFHLCKIKAKEKTSVAWCAYF